MEAHQITFGPYIQTGIWLYFAWVVGTSLENRWKNINAVKHQMLFVKMKLLVLFTVEV